MIFTVTQENTRIDKLISAEYPQYSRSCIQKLFVQAKVLVDGKTVSKNYIPKIGSRIEFLVAVEAETLTPKAQKIELKLAYEDDDLLVVDKPRGMVVHPAAGNPDRTLVNALLSYCGDELSSLSGPGRPGIVHRLDKDTSGLIIVAKNDKTHLKLAKQLKEHTMKREYLAVVHGVIKNHEGTVDKPIGRSKNDRKKFAVNVENAKEAVSHYTLLEQFDKYALIKVKLVTGRTHQIRVHMASIGFPVAGDRVYGPKSTPSFLDGQCLHAYCLGFTHPRSGEYLELISELPQYFEDFLERIKN